MRFRFIIFFLVFTSCKPLISTIEGINQERDYTDIHDYASFYSNKLEVDSNKIFFFKEYEDLNKFFRELRENHLTYFYGVKVEDKLFRLNKDVETNSCLGLINEIVQKKNISTETYIEAKYDLKVDLLMNTENIHPIINKDVVIFILSDKLGNTNHKNIKHIIQEMNIENTDFFLISVDHIR